jgi:NADH-quinone oxidoreductase subunit L
MVVVIGASTAFFAATVALVQNDIKRVIAYSTCSQLGYMFVAAGVGAYEAAMFHLFTHAFFKALLFLGSGSVIIAMHHEQDMRKMGGLRHKIPLTYWTMVIGTLSITGFGIPLLLILDTPIGFAGFVSKDMIIESSFAAASGAGKFAFTLLVAAAAMTAFYSWRLIFMTFHGQTRADPHTYDHAHDSPNTMMIPLYLLAIGAVLAGMNWYPEFVGHAEAEWWGAGIFNGAGNEVMHDSHGIPILAKLAPFIAMVAGFGLAYQMYIRKPHLPAQLARQQRALYLFLLNKWYFDELYEFLFVNPAKWLGRFLWKRGDGSVIDGFLNGVAMGLVPRLTRYAGKMQSGYLYHYAFVMLIGLSALITWIAISGGSH